ncbi:hypothetical protein AJ78_04988 [Emergomyces pasteurianus Ep9510]|uniref:Flavin reductase like domain-containing protein n=1 Tax=Emergomyces pasteurianus Ep9510 TaxID=1447872 RepID=A0A1J9PDW0_9EURO|nr:hypothetical protein AJ78_04988 [Emergomyces pasteurianus Ep9510]
MLRVGYSSSLRSTRGARVLFQVLHNIRLPHVPPRHGGPLVSSPTRCHFLRSYGLLRTILSKHATSITDSIRLVLPGQTPQETSLPNQSTAKSARTIEQRIDYYASQNNVAESPVIVDEDTSEAPEATRQNEATNPDTEIGDQVRLLMRRVPHPVAIITSTDPGSPTARTAFRGMTVSSFNTVTLYPETVVSFNVKLPSETFNAIHSSSRFLVHLLAPTHATARLARDFSQGNANVMLEDEKQRFFKFVPLSGKDNDLMPSIAEGEPPRLALINNARGGSAKSSLRSKSEDGDDVPIITTADYFPFVFECRYIPQSVRVGNHVVVLGRVINIIRHDVDGTLDHVKVHSPDHLCLSYADTRFWKIGDNISVN